MRKIVRPDVLGVVEWVEDWNGNNCGVCSERPTEGRKLTEGQRSSIWYGLNRDGRTLIWWCARCGWTYQPTPGPFGKYHLHGRKPQRVVGMSDIPKGCLAPGCQCNGTRDVALHHIRFRSEGGTDSKHNLIPLCIEAHKRAHEGYRVSNAGQWISGRQYMIDVLTKLRKQPWFRWARVLQYLEDRESLKRVGK